MYQHVEGLTMSQAFYRSVELYPDRVAQLFNANLYGGDSNGIITWKGVANRVEQIASGLMALGLDKRQRVAIMAPNSPYWTHIDIAVINLGAVLVTIYPTLSANEAAYIANDSESEYLFVGNQDILDRILLGKDKLAGIKKVIVIDPGFKSPGDPWVISLADLMEMGRSTLATHKAEYEARWRSNTLDDWATILYTSGTTGAGKGVILSHWCMASRMDGALEYFIHAGHPLTNEDRVLSFLPLSHIFDRACSQWAAIYLGASIAYADSPATLINDLSLYNPTWFSCVPRLYEKIYMQFQQQLMASPLKKKLFDWALGVGYQVLAYRTDEKGRIDMRPECDIKSRLPFGLQIRYAIADQLFAKVRALFGSRFRFSFSASAGIAPELLKFFYVMGLPVLEGYGLTETCSACTYNPMFGAKPGTIGPEANRSKARVAEDGELEIYGAGNFLGYLNQPEETAAAFTPDGWFRTGDLVEVDEDGYYRIVDRKKAIICLDTGKNVAPLKLESRFATSLAVEQIFPVGDEKPYISALIVPSFNYFMDLFDKQGVSYDRSKIKMANINGANICVEVGKDFVSQPLLQMMVAEAVAEANQSLEEFETIKQYEIITRRFTEENGELTPTQKPKKRVILENYKDTIEGLYRRHK